MSDSKLRSMSLDFAVDAVKWCEAINIHRSLINQFERSATSIGANVHEANYAQSKADFISKLQIALKECFESEYWLELFIRANIASGETIKPLCNQCTLIRRLLIASINTAKANMDKE